MENITKYQSACSIYPGKYVPLLNEDTITEKVKPSFIISGGVSAQSSTNPLNLNPNVGLTVGFKNKNGYNLDINYNTQNNVMVTVKKDLFTFWGKN